MWAVAQRARRAWSASELQTTTGTSITSSSVTNSSPWYDYASDTVYVGDDAGNLFKVTPVLGSGTPVVTGLILFPQ